MTQIDTSTAAIEALLKDVTLGPWASSNESIDPDWAIVTTSGGAIVANVNGASQHNARFIAAARELVPALLAERAALQSEVDRLKAQVVTAYSSGLRAALGVIASLGYGKNEHVDHGHEEAYRAIERYESEWVKHPSQAITARTEDEVWNEAIEAAAYACDDYPRAAPDGHEWPLYDEQIAHSKDCIRYLKRPVKGDDHFVGSNNMVQPEDKGGDHE